MAARKTTARSTKKPAGRKRRASGTSDRVRRWLPVGLLLLGVLLGVGIGFGLAMLPPAPLPAPFAMEVPPAKPAAPPLPAIEKKKAELAPAPTPAPVPAEVTASYAALATPLSASAPAPTLTEPAAPAIAPAAPAQQLVSQVVTPQTAALLPDEAQPLWLRNAAAFLDPGTKPMIAIVLDDVGVAPLHARAALDLPAPIVLSIMTYAEKGEAFASEARQRGHEVMVHMPMQPMSASVDPGANALTVGLDAAEIRRRVDWGLTRFPGYVGFNNHMGSKFTQNVDGMRTVLEIARERGLLFLDSKTIANSVGDTLAAEMGVTHIARDVFLDDTLTEAAVARQLVAVEAIARKRGYAVAIGHPHPATIAVLKRWLPEMAKRGIAIVPLTAIVKKRDGVTG
jgi:polysaccharide deacetylase 2 family uncharacterized protein YibQ